MTIRRRSAEPWLPKVSIGLAALGFGGFGLVLLIAPGVLGLIGVEIGRPAGAVELRAFYGGLELGMAVFFAAAVMRPGWWRPALVVQVLAIGGAALGRLFAVVIGGGGEPLVYALMAAEAAGGAVGLVALLTLPPSAADAGISGDENHRRGGGAQ